MTLKIDDWYDWARLVIFVICFTCVVILVSRFSEHRNEWNEKTKDHWFSGLMWCLAGAVGVLQGIVFDIGLGPAMVFVAAASLASLKGLVKKGVWGGDDRRR